MKILILGASGLVGGNCLKYFNQQGIETAGTHYSFRTRHTAFFDTLDLENSRNFNVRSFAPTHILHAGALTHVDRCEQHPDESFQQTVQSTLNLIKLSEELNARLIYISTDYVFDGLNGPYSEEDAVNPISIYGRHKLEAEQAVLASNPGNLVLRITNVYGDEIRNKNFVARLRKACMEMETLELKLPHDQYATPVNGWDVARALLLLLKDGKSGIYNISSTDYLNRVQLADKVLRHFSEHKVTVIPMLTTMLAQPAARPLQGGLKAGKFLSEYPEFDFRSVDEYLESHRNNMNN